uniref:CSON012814 protein n=1 Tax=Culicoides sonorensis TaxID=179676 RepID=A0A336MAD9_CULSO
MRKFYLVIIRNISLIQWIKSPRHKVSRTARDLERVSTRHPSVMNWAPCCAMVLRHSSKRLRKALPRSTIKAWHSSMVLSSNLPSVIKRENNSLPDTMAVIGFSVSLREVTVDWISDLSFALNSNLTFPFDSKQTKSEAQLIFCCRSESCCFNSNLIVN